MLESQGKQREDLVRDHFSLFVHCTDELVWLKDFRRECKLYLYLYVTSAYICYMRCT